MSYTTSHTSTSHGSAGKQDASDMQNLESQLRKIASSALGTVSQVGESNVSIKHCSDLFLKTIAHLPSETANTICQQLRKRYTPAPRSFVAEATSFIAQRILGYTVKLTPEEELQKTCREIAENTILEIESNNGKKRQFKKLFFDKSHSLELLAAHLPAHTAERKSWLFSLQNDVHNQSDVILKMRFRDIRSLVDKSDIIVQSLLKLNLSQNNGASMALDKQKNDFLQLPIEAQRALRILLGPFRSQNQSPALTQFFSFIDEEISKKNVLEAVMHFEQKRPVDALLLLLTLPKDTPLQHPALYDLYVHTRNFADAINTNNTGYIIQVLKDKNAPLDTIREFIDLHRTRVLRPEYAIFKVDLFLEHARLAKLIVHELSREHCAKALALYATIPPYLREFCLTSMPDSCQKYLQQHPMK